MSAEGSRSEGPASDAAVVLALHLRAKQILSEAAEAAARGAVLAEIVSLRRRAGRLNQAAGEFLEALHHG